MWLFKQRNAFFSLDSFNVFLINQKKKKKALGQKVGRDMKQIIDLFGEKLRTNIRHYCIQPF